MNQPTPEFDPVIRQTLRGVVASPRRARRMRDELLAHLLCSYDEELPRHPGDPAAATAAALRRLGHPATLRDQLQDSVPLAERLFFRFLPRKEIAMSRWIWLLAVCTFLIGTSIVLPALGRFKNQGVPWSTVAPSVGIGLAAAFAGLGTIIYGLARRLRRPTAA